ncbi:MAG TPA: addiction module protein [Oscillatoriales cyanobacterium M59_W2019_021]|nr:MAG: acyl-protein synthetase [Cyanobacteria bacterium J055]HIK32960.1 addiction module protein [Oscillatoriales cyanobacterium M4454_W2019_049]HIK52574.1 addiction module protein [Oscillatoriales cyanobacterium M59_W2019_021]
MNTLEQITQIALSLLNTLRVLLIESLEFDIDESVQASWTTVAQQRLKEIRSGVVQPIPGDEALARVRKLLG